MGAGHHAGLESAQGAMAFVKKEGTAGAGRQRGRHMNQEKRRKYILDQLKIKSSISVSELSEAFSLSEVSVRKLLASMEQEGVLKRTWGGAVSRYGSLREFSHQENEVRHREEKRAIAMAAYDCIQDGEAIFLDSGTTVCELARLIVEGPKRNIMPCTNNIYVAMELAKASDIHSIIIGGELRTNIYSCVGNLAEQVLGNLFFDKGFISGNHFTVERGFSTPTLGEAELKRKILSISKEKIMMLDYTKFGDDSMVLIARPEDIDVLITDWHAPEELVESFGDKGVKTVVAPQL